MRHQIPLREGVCSLRFYTHFLSVYSSECKMHNAPRWGPRLSLAPQEFFERKGKTRSYKEREIGHVQWNVFKNRKRLLAKTGRNWESGTNLSWLVHTGKTFLKCYKCTHHNNTITCSDEAEYMPNPSKHSHHM